MKSAGGRGHRNPALGAALAWLVLPLGSASAQPALDTSQQYIIYGEDDRREFFEVQSSTFREVARRSVVALMSPRNLRRVAGGYVPAPVTLGDQLLCVSATECLPMCADEPYLEQPSAGECSGVLVDDDLVLTAGHCFDGAADDCNRYRYVFDFHYEAEERLADIGEDDVYGCEELVLWASSTARGKEARDYALIKLDRKVDAQRAPVTLRGESLGEGDFVAAVGYPIGLPVKVDMGGVVQDARTETGDYFTATTDTFVGNSGSGMFDDEGHLVGHLVLGGEDFEVEPSDDCLSTVVVADGEVPPLYEHGVYVDTWRSALCADDYPSERLCGDDAPPIKAPDLGGSVDGDGGAVGSPKSGGRCTAAPGSTVLAPWLALLGLWLVRRRRTA